MSTLDNPLMEQDQTTSSTNIALRYGGIIALVMIVIGLLQYLTGMSDPENAQTPTAMIIGVLTFVVWIGGVVMAVRDYRQSLGGFINFGQAFRTGFTTFLVIAAISAAWNFLFYSFIATDFLEKMLDFMQYAMEDAGADDSAIDMMMGIYGRVYTPGGMTLMSLLGGTMMGAVVSLIIGAVMKKSAPEV